MTYWKDEEPVDFYEGEVGDGPAAVLYPYRPVSPGRSCCSIKSSSTFNLSIVRLIGTLVGTCLVVLLPLVVAFACRAFALPLFVWRVPT